MKTRFVPCIVARLAVVALGGALLLTPVVSAKNVKKLDVHSQAEVESLLTSELQDVLDAQKRIAGQAKFIKVHVSIDYGARGAIVVIGLERGFLPKRLTYFPSALEEITTKLADTASEVLRGTVQVEGVRFLYGGKPIEHYLPKERVSRPSNDVPDIQTSAAGGRIALSAGHGIYYHYGFADWRPQRDPSNAITEDFITPLYAATLAGVMDTRGRTTQYFPRSSGPPPCIRVATKNGGRLPVATI